MKFTTSCAMFVLLLSATAAQAQMYKWVGPDGKVTYSDSPPPKSAKSVEQKDLSGGSGMDTSNLPYEVAEAAKNSPVTFYTSSKCTPCDDGRNYLNKRGIPFREKTVTNSDDLNRLKEATGEGQLPVLMIGRGKQLGYDAGAWGAALTAAGYPESNKLPKTYRNTAAEAAAPKPAQAAASKPAAEQAPARADSLPPATGNAPPGFRF